MNYHPGTSLGVFFYAQIMPEELLDIGIFSMNCTDPNVQSVRL